MKINEFYIVGVELPDRENFVVEMVYEGHQWVEISKEDDEVMIQFYGCSEKDTWEFSFEEAVEGLKEAKEFLFKKRGIESKEDDFEKRKYGTVEEKRSVFPEAEGTVEDINSLAEEMLKKILYHPDAYETIKHSGRFGKIRDIRTPDKSGARYTMNDEFLTFLEY